MANKSLKIGNGIRKPRAAYGSIAPRAYSRQQIDNLEDIQMVEETFDRMDTTHLALEYDASSLNVGAGTTTAITTGNLVLTTDANIGDTAALLTKAASIDPGNLPMIESKVTLTSVAGVEYYFGLYKDANEYAYLYLDASTSANWYFGVYDGTTQEALNTGIAATTSETKLSIAVDSNGDAHAWVDDVYVDVFDLGESVQPSTTTDKMKAYMLVKTEAAAAKVATIPFFQLSQEK